MQEQLAVGLPLPEADAGRRHKGKYITEGKAADKKQNQGKNLGFCFWRKGHKLIQCMPYDSMHHYKSTDAHANLICMKARCAADYLPDLGSVFNFSVVKGYIPAVICHAVYEGNIRVSCRQGNSLYRISITIPPGPVVFLGNGISSGNQTMDGGAAVSGDGHSDALTGGVVIHDFLNLVDKYLVCFSHELARMGWIMGFAAIVPRHNVRSYPRPAGDKQYATGILHLDSSNPLFCPYESQVRTGDIAANTLIGYRQQCRDSPTA